jgi:hypothetical protein
MGERAERGGREMEACMCGEGGTATPGGSGRCGGSNQASMWDGGRQGAGSHCNCGGTATAAMPCCTQGTPLHTRPAVLFHYLGCMAWLCCAFTPHSPHLMLSPQALEVCGWVRWSTRGGRPSSAAAAAAAVGRLLCAGGVERDHATSVDNMICLGLTYTCGHSCSFAAYIFVVGCSK